MKLEISGVIKEIQPLQLIEGEKPFKKQTLVIEDVSNSTEKYTSNIALTVLNEKIIESIPNFKLMDNVSIVCFVDSKKWKDRWFTEFRLQSIDNISLTDRKQENTQDSSETNLDNFNDDLPF